MASGGGGRGAMPILLLSLAAAAAAAEAYLSVSPGARCGTAAGFIEAPLLIFDSGVCSVASVGRGLFTCCVEALRVAGASLADVAFDFPPGILLDRASASGASSCIDCVSCDDPRSACRPARSRR